MVFIKRVLELDGVTIPYTEEGGVNYYPIKYIFEQFLLKGTCQLHKKDDYKMHIKRYIIDFSFKGTTEQECYCMDKEGWIKYLNNSRKNKNKTFQKIKRLNILLEFFGQPKVDFYESKNYDDYTLSCIKTFRSKSPKVKDKTCLSCGRELPNSHYFFNKDNRIDVGIVNICRQCNNGEFLNDNIQDKYIYDTFGLAGFSKYKNGEVLFYKEHILSNNKNKLKLPKNDKTFIKRFILQLIKNLYDDKFLSKQDLNYKTIIDKLVNIDFSGHFKSLNNNEINEYCSEGDCKNRPWLYPNYKLGKIDFNFANEILKRYISENNIIIEDIFKYKEYGDLLRKSKLTQFNNNLLYFIVQFYNFEYAGYKFKIASPNYYKDVNMRIFDFKWLVEKDFKVEINKIPLYITKYTINLRSHSMYNVIGKYYKSLYEWVNECYPDIFIENDFTLNPYRSVFDSLEEAQINEILKNNLNNVIYNPRNTENTINIMGMIPDWIMISEYGCYLIEYFGLYSEKTESSHRLQMYENKLKIKLLKYKELEKVGYKSLHIYPNDLKNNFEGLLKKIDQIKKS